MTYRNDAFENVDEDVLKALCRRSQLPSPYIEKGLHREPWVDMVQNKAFKNLLKGGSRITATRWLEVEKERKKWRDPLRPTPGLGR
jgi:hypothetical protein